MSEAASKKRRKFGTAPLWILWRRTRKFTLPKKRRSPKRKWSIDPKEKKKRKWSNPCFMLITKMDSLLWCFSTFTQLVNHNSWIMIVQLTILGVKLGLKYELKLWTIQFWSNDPNSLTPWMRKTLTTVPFIIGFYRWKDPIIVKH